MQKLIGFAAVVGFVAFLATQVVGYLQKDLKVRAARSRVQAMLTAVASGDEQSAISQWAQGVPLVPSSLLEDYADAYAPVAEELGLKKGIQWSIDAVEPPHIDVTIDGKKLRFRHWPGKTLEVVE